MTDTNNVKPEGIPPLVPTETATPAETATPVPQPKPAESPKLYKIILNENKPSVVMYDSSSEGCGKLDRFQSVTVTIKREGRTVYTNTYNKYRGKPIFKTPAAGEYTVQVSEVWTDYKTQHVKNYGSQKFTVK